MKPKMIEGCVDAKIEGCVDGKMCYCLQPSFSSATKSEVCKMQVLMLESKTLNASELSSMRQRLLLLLPRQLAAAAAAA